MTPLSLFDPMPSELPMRDAQVHYYPAFLTQSQADYFQTKLRESLQWRQDNIKMYGKEVRIPRLHAWYGDKEAAYQYSHLTLQPLPWTLELKELRNRIEAYSDCEFNAVLANYYRDGQDSMGWHADDEPELGPRPTIASLTLGEPRDFDFRHQKSGAKYRLNLQHGSLLLMAGDTQCYWQHALPKRLKLSAERLNLTFRKIIQAP